MTPPPSENDALDSGPNCAKANARQKHIPTTSPSPHLSSDAVAAQPGSPRTKPRWRGFLHQYGFFVAIVPATILVATAPKGRASISAAVYVMSLLALLGTSALYHRIAWPPGPRFWMGKADSAMIFVLIAGSFTPVALLVLPPPLTTASLLAVWGAAGVGGFMVFVSHSRPKWASSVLYVTITAIGALLFLPQISKSLDPIATAMFVGSGLIYLGGAVVYGLQRPDPWPKVFGYHEIFHSLVLLAATVHFIAVAVYVLPRGS